MFYRDGLKPIVISSRRLYDLLVSRVGKKSAKAMAYCTRTAHWKKGALRETIGHSHKLVDIRLLHLFGVVLSPHQQVILLNNRQKFVKKRTDVVRSPL